MKTASPEETAAIAVAIERFVRATAPAPTPIEEDADQWTHAAILEGVAREDPGDVPDPWIYP